MISTNLSSGQWSLFLGAGRQSLDYPLEAGIEYPSYLISNFTHNWSSYNSYSIIVSTVYDRSYVEDNERSIYRWFGVQTDGQLHANPRTSLSYWAQLAMMTGAADYIVEGSVNAADTMVVATHRGWAYDFGITTSTVLPGKPEITLSFADSSGDRDTNDDVNTHYSQSGIHTNSADIGSTYGISYYGNVLAPELSNLSVAAIGMTFPILNYSYISVFSRHYRQVNNTPSINNLSFEMPLTGASRDVGQSIDIELSYFESSRWSAALSVGMFQPGEAVVKPVPTIFYGLLQFSRVF